MYVCLCMGTTSHVVMECVERGATSTRAVAEACGAGSLCGRCRHTVRTIIAFATSEGGDEAPSRPTGLPDVPAQRATDG